METETVSEMEIHSILTQQDFIAFIHSFIHYKQLFISRNTVVIPGMIIIFLTFMNISYKFTPFK